MKKLVIIISLITASFSCFTSCNNDDKPRPAQILVTVSGECVCNVFIYTPEGLCLRSQIWDCQETKVLVFNIYHEGTVNVTGEYKSKRISETYEIKYGKKTTASLIF